MKRFNKFLVLLSLAQLLAFSQAQAQEVSLSIQESVGGCGLATDCAGTFICFDIGMTVDIDKNLDSYNIWVQYDQSVISRLTGGDDISCVIGTGNPTDLEVGSGAWRVTGEPAAPQPMTGGVEILVHTICFSILDENALSGSTLIVGGNLFDGALLTTVTFNDESTDDVPEEFPLILNEATLSCLSLLPVELLAFQAEKKGDDVELGWKTANEHLSSHFEVERSRDGRDFLEIGIVKSKGSYSTTESYHFSDISPFWGNNYYRLKQVDLDGNYTYSGIRLVNTSTKGEFALYQNEPNPFRSQTTIGFDLPAEALAKEGGTYMSVTLRIFSESGKLVKEITGDYSAGYNKVLIDRNDLPTTGVVYYHLQAGEFMASKKMVLLE